MDKIPKDAHFKVEQREEGINVWRTTYEMPNGEIIDGSFTATAAHTVDWFIWLNEQGYNINLYSPEYAKLNEWAYFEHRNRRWA